MKKLKLHWLVAAGALALSCSAWSAVVGQLEGVPIEDSVTVAGTKLILNGAAVRKRGYFKTDVTSLYLTSARRTFDGIVKESGPKRIRLDVLRDISGEVITKYFISDFKLVTTDDEFKQLIKEVGQVGDLYGRMGHVNKGDVVTVDWVPGKGITTKLNGKLVTYQSMDPSGYMNNALFYEVLLRMYVGQRAASDYRDGLLGLINHFGSAPAVAEVAGAEDKPKPQVAAQAKPAPVPVPVVQAKPPVEAPQEAAPAAPAPVAVAAEQASVPADAAASAAPVAPKPKAHKHKYVRKPRAVTPSASQPASST